MRSGLKTERGRLATGLWGLCALPARAVAVERVDLLERRPVDPPHRVRDQARLERDSLARSVAAPSGRVGALGGLELRAGCVERCPQRRRARVEVALAAVAVGELAGDLAPEQRAQVLVQVRVPAAPERAAARARRAAATA